MNKTAFKIFICFTFSSAAVATILLAINFIGFVIIGSDTSASVRDGSPQGTLVRIDEALIKTNDGFTITNDDIINPDCWCILIDSGGDIIWSQNKPEDIPERYSINDVAKMTRWFLNDYPVYVRTSGYGLIVLGIPKNSVGKYDMTYSMEWFDTLPKRLAAILLLNMLLAASIAFIFGIKLYRQIRAIIDGINDLTREKRVFLRESGIFREVSRSINKTAEAVERKNLALARRDNARSNWISGVSHDIRTPLSVIMGYSAAISESEGLSAADRAKAKAISVQSIKIKKLIDDLNLISSLEYDMQPSKKSNICICPLLRSVAADIINGGISDNFKIELNLHDEKAFVSADEALLERAIFNLINNSIIHNKNGCNICISEYSGGGTVYISISDNGAGVPDKVIDRITEIPKATHGLGLPMAYRIIHVHGGKFSAENDNGFTVKIELPSVT